MSRIPVFGHCPICDGWRGFRPHRGRRGARCPSCNALERHRFLFLHIEGLGIDGKRVLHVAPEPAIKAWLAEHAGEYRTTDLNPEGVDFPASLEALPLPDASFDVVVCNHVLEHVPDDRVAMRELRRVCRGTLITMHPVHRGTTTVEDPSVVDPDERMRVFGQEDHVRLYGDDFPDRLREAGFALSVISPDRRQVRRHRLLPNEQIYVGT